MKQIINSNGSISEYGFACGYTQTVETDNLHKELYKEHNVYHVRSLINNSPELSTQFDGKTSHNYIIWEGYNKLSDARKLFKAIK